VLQLKLLTMVLMIFLLSQLNTSTSQFVSRNCRKSDDVFRVGELVQRSEHEMMRTPNFGRKSLNEIKEVLENMGLELGMKLENWPPQDATDSLDS